MESKAHFCVGDAAVRSSQTAASRARVCAAGEEARTASDAPAGVLRAAKAGDAVAIRALLEAVTPGVARAVRAVVGSTADDADDLTQEALVALLDALPAFREESSVLRYACRIAVRTALPERKKLRRRDDLFDSFASGETARGEREPTDMFVREDRRALVRTLLAELPQPQAEAIAHQVIWGASLEEIADEAGVSVNTIRTRLRLAKEALRRKLVRRPDLLDLLGAGR
jgi:RNA polymerase sigma-70 factor (ECF subfamily)